jgi:hypothetical protein
MADGRNAALPANDQLSLLEAAFSLMVRSGLSRRNTGLQSQKILWTLGARAETG